MPLIPEKSINSWAEKLAEDERQPFREVLHVIGLAVINHELPTFFCGHLMDWSKPYPGTATDRIRLVLPSINSPGVFKFSYLGEGNDNPDSPPIKEHLDDIMIKTADMNRWLHDRGVVNDDPTSVPVTSPTLDEIIKSLIATMGKPGRGGPRHKEFAQRVRELWPTPLTDAAIEQKVRRL